MPDLPRDPRQLARDILAGKISIEQLAREQQRRRAGGAVPPPQAPPQQRLPQKIPLPRPAPPPQQRPILRPVARPSPTRTAPPRPAPKPVRPSARPALTPQPPPQQQIPTAQARGGSESQTNAGRARPAQIERKLGVRRLLANRAAVRQGIVMAEILGPPVSLREDF